LNKRPIAALACLAFLACAGSVHASEAKKNYALGVQGARHQDYDAAFMYFRAVLREPVEEPCRQEALFATGEYYYLKGIYTEAQRTFLEYLTAYPSSVNRIFALAYLFRIAEKNGRRELASRIGRQIVTMRQVSLLFRESKEYKYVSALQRVLKVVYYIDKVEFYDHEELFARIPY
jgi:outer membrane protein assembly factor BamD (BamD/ComL family)